jgi:hypothetical protein
VDGFIFMKGNIPILKFKHVPFTLQFVPTNVAFVKDGVINTAFAQKIAPCQAGLAETKMEGVVESESVKGVEFTELY